MEPAGDTGSMSMPEAVADPLGIDPRANHACNAPERTNVSDLLVRTRWARANDARHRAGERRMDPS